MMEGLELPEQIVMLHACCLGIMISFVYDVIRIVRRVFPHGKGMVALEDLVFWIFCTVWTFLFLYHVSNGECRWFSVLGAVLSIVFYEKLLGRHFVYGTSVILTKLLRLFCKKPSKKVDVLKQRAKMNIRDGES